MSGRVNAEVRDEIAAIKTRAAALTARLLETHTDSERECLEQQLAELHARHEELTCRHASSTRASLLLHTART